MCEDFNYETLIQENLDTCTTENLHLGLSTI